MIKIPYYEASHFVFSNFSAHQVVYLDVTYPTAEHAFHAQKFVDADVRERIQQCGSPLEAWQLGTTLKDEQRPDWNEVKVSVLTDIVRQKAAQHSEVRDALIASGGEEILEVNPHDSFWGSGADGTGQNTTGKILMSIRDELRQNN